ncbi:hypothetical protein CEXT_112901 [Caerostris extrusa]|uniref:Uncharacterized protein n=1 Tax=Caerostris extrusa TaxID=172846 RepID=A0AAV4Q982_CAEEX|nr:hypothetical protein CEXT_112901 [Caerostris extrusa]
MASPMKSRDTMAVILSKYKRTREAATDASVRRKVSRERQEVVPYRMSEQFPTTRALNSVRKRILGIPMPGH